MKNYTYFKENLTPQNENFARNCCYEFLECDADTNMTTIRENFLYKIIEASRQMEGVSCYHGLYYDNPTDEVRHFLEELRYIRNDVVLLCDSYLAILLEKLDSKLYDSIIKGLYFRWKEYNMYFYADEMEEQYGYTGYNPYFPFRFPREEEYFELEDGLIGNELLPPTYITGEEYLDVLKNINDYSTNNGFLNFTSSLSIIIELEKGMLKDHQVIKEYRKKFGEMGRIHQKNESAKKYAIVKEKTPQK